MNPVSKIEEQQRSFSIRRIKRDHYGRISLETKREDMEDGVMDTVDWFADLPPVRMRVPNVLIRGGDYIRRMKVSYSLFAMLMQKLSFREVEVETAKNVILDFKRRTYDRRLKSVKFLILHDCEMFEDEPAALDDLAIERWRKGNITVFVGRDVFASDVLGPILKDEIVKIELQEDGVEVIHNHRERIGN